MWLLEFRVLNATRWKLPAMPSALPEPSLPVSRYAFHALDVKPFDESMVVKFTSPLYQYVPEGS